MKQGIIPILAELRNYGFYRIFFKRCLEACCGFLSGRIVVKHEFYTFDLRVAQEIVG